MSTEMQADPHSTSELVIEAIADHANVDPLDLDVPLGNVIDPDALDSLFSSPLGDVRHEGSIEFDYDGHRVTVVSEAETGISVDVAPIEGSVAPDSSVGIQQA